MITVVDVINDALNHLHVRPIHTIDDNVEAAIRAKSVFDLTRDTVLADHWWEFATFIESLTQMSGESLTGWEYLYAIPQKCLEIRKLFVDESSTNPDPIDYRRCVSNTTFLPAVAANYVNPYMEYTRQVTDPKLWSPRFAEALGLRLAAKLSGVLTGKPELGNMMMNLYAYAISEAKRLDADAAHITKPRKSTMIEAR